MDNVILLFNVEFRTNRQTQYTVAKVFRNRQIHNLFIGRLPMQRDWIIDHRRDSEVHQMLFQRIAHCFTIAFQRILVKNVRAINRSLGH